MEREADGNKHGTGPNLKVKLTLVVCMEAEEVLEAEEGV